VGKVIGLKVTNAAERIGRVYRGGLGNLREAGYMLQQQKDSMKHGEWLPWLIENQKKLGFSANEDGCRTATRLMALAKSDVNDRFDLWGNDSRDSMDVHYSSDTDEWETPQDLFDELDEEFGFELDVCATAKNAKCKRFYNENGLDKKWSGICWMNPPYGDVIGDWVEKARLSAVNGTIVVCLVPARVDTNWWWDNCRYGEIRFLRGRLKFGGAESSAPFPSAVVIFGHPAQVIWWER
jgi:phage N-6-adenine-methyltransferase